jgi:hypothetical protein
MFFQNISINIRFHVLTAANMKFRVIWDVAPCIPVLGVQVNNAKPGENPEKHK